MSFMHALSSTTFVSSGMRRLQMKLSTTQCAKTMKYSLPSQGTGILWEVKMKQVEREFEKSLRNILSK